MYKRISQSDFVNEFKSWETYANNFSWQGLEALYDYFESIAEDMGYDKGIELDVVAIYNDYTEYTSAWQAMLEYQPEDMPTVDGEGLDLVELGELEEEAALEWLQDRTSVIEFEGGVIIGQF